MKDSPIGSSHVDFAAVRTEEGRQYLLVATDRTGQVAFAERPRAPRGWGSRIFCAGY